MGAALTENDLRELVTRFYGRIRQNAQLGPIFETAVDDWDAHIEVLTAFWSSIMFKSGRYKGNPFAAHTPFAGQLTPDHFATWLALWSETVRELFADPLASAFEEKAGRIAESLQAGLLFDPGATEAGQGPPGRSARDPQSRTPRIQDIPNGHIEAKDD